MPPPPPLPRHAALLLDFDGTLVELAGRPDAVRVDDALHALLGRLADRLDERIALVSGRSIAQLDAFLGESALRLSAIGSHGGEARLAGGAITAPVRPAALDAAVRLFADRFAGRDGVIIEEKSLGVALHYRLDPDAEIDAHDIVDRFAAEHVLEVQRGKMMVELRLPGHDKGTAILALMDSPPFAGHLPIFLGDDLTDEPGFAACAARGGWGVLVGPERASAARYRLSGVAAVHTWLGA